MAKKSGNGSKQARNAPTATQVSGARKSVKPAAKAPPDAARTAPPPRTSSAAARSSNGRIEGPIGPSDRALPAVRIAGPVDPLPDTLAALEDLRKQTQAQLDATTDTALRGTYNDLLDAVSDTVTQLNREAIAEHTISLEAAADELDPGIDALQRLRTKLASIAATIAAVAHIVATIDGVISGIKSVLATFG